MPDGNIRRSVTSVSPLDPVTSVSANRVLGVSYLIHFTRYTEIFLNKGFSW